MTKKIRVFFLWEPPQYEMEFQLKRFPAKTVRRILELAAAHQRGAVRGWERSQADE